MKMYLMMALDEEDHKRYYNLFRGEHECLYEISKQIDPIDVETFHSKSQILNLIMPSSHFW